MRRTLYVLFFAVISFAIFSGNTFDKKNDDFVKMKMHCPYLEMMYSNSEQNLCPYIEGKNKTENKCPYLNETKNDDTNGKCPFLEKGGKLKQNNRKQSDKSLRST